MLQEKAQDRERLLLKFIKIMKVTWGPLPRGDPPTRPRPPSRLPPPPCSSVLSREPERWGVGPVPQHLDWGFWPQKRCVRMCAYMHAQV